MDISKTYLFYLLGILILGVIGQEQRPVKDRKRGALIGKLKTIQHQVSGVVWALDEDTLYIEDFHYDGTVPDTFFWIGNVTQPTPKGSIVPYPKDSSNQKPKGLPRIEGENLILDLPLGTKIADIKYLSVWWRRFTVDFGHVLIPGNLDPPKMHVLPEFKRLAHGVRSGNVTILDAKMFYIPNLHYDGAGPDAFFWVGNGNEPNQQGQKIPNEIGSYDVLRGYEGEDIYLQLPENLTVYDIDYLSIWCVTYRHNFGHVLLPPASQLWVPPSLGQNALKSGRRFGEDSRDVYEVAGKPSTIGTPKFENCRQLTDTFQVEWQAKDRYVEIRLTAKLRTDQYVAFGISPDQSRAQMVNSDIVVAYFDDGDESYHAVDYSVTGKAQCDGSFGVCPDERVNGINDASVISGERHDGITSITYSRPYKASDRMDIEIKSENRLVSIVAAIGTLNSRKEANYHNEFVTKDLQTIDFLGTGENSCSSFISEPAAPVFEPWPTNFIRGTYNFSAVIGPTGGGRGYSAITGSPSWGIAWWINDMLIPEIYVERGQTYYFTVEGGDSINNSAKHHPFYLTDSSEGGFSQKTISEQRRERIFAGVTFSEKGTPQPTAQGRLCEWQHKSVDSWEDSLTFDEYRRTLHKRCEPGLPGSLTWTVAQDTPDLVYYQCYTHRNLGWKIHVHDPGFNLPQNGATSFGLSVWLGLVVVVIVSFR